MSVSMRELGANRECKTRKGGCVCVCCVCVCVCVCVVCVWCGVCVCVWCVCGACDATRLVGVLSAVPSIRRSLAGIPPSGSAHASQTPALPQGARAALVLGNTGTRDTRTSRGHSN